MVLVHYNVSRFLLNKRAFAVSIFRNLLMCDFFYLNIHLSKSQIFKFHKNTVAKHLAANSFYHISCKFQFRSPHSFVRHICKITQNTVYGNSKLNYRGIGTYLQLSLNSIYCTLELPTL